MKLRPFLLTTVVLTALLTPLTTMAMLPSSCGIFRHWAYLEGLRNAEAEKAKNIQVYRFDLDVDGDGHATLFLSSPAAEARGGDYRVMHIYSPTRDGKTYVYLGQLALAGFWHDTAASRLVGIEVDEANGTATIKAYSVSHKGLVVDPDLPVSRDQVGLEDAKRMVASWVEKSQKEWWRTDLAALKANVWKSAALTWTGEATGEKSELSNGLFNVMVSRDRSLGKSKAKSECKTMKR